MPPGELAALWQQYLHAFAALLLRMRGDTQSSAAQRLVRRRRGSRQLQMLQCISCCRSVMSACPASSCGTDLPGIAPGGGSC